MFLQKAGRFLLPSLRTSSALCKLLIVTGVPGITPIILLSPYNKCHQTMSILIASLVLSNSVVSFAFLLDVHDEKVMGMHPCSSSQRHGVAVTTPESNVQSLYGCYHALLPVIYSKFG